MDMSETCWSSGYPSKIDDRTSVDLRISSPIIHSWISNIDFYRYLCKQISTGYQTTELVNVVTLNQSLG